MRNHGVIQGRGITRQGKIIIVVILAVTIMSLWYVVHWFGMDDTSIDTYTWSCGPEAVDELVSYCYRSESSVEVSTWMETLLLEKRIPLTFEEADIECTCEILYGYKTSDIRVEPDIKNGRVLIALPEIRVLKSSLDMRYMDWWQKDPFSPNLPWSIPDALEKTMYEARMEADLCGVPEEARENAKQILRAQYEVLGYQVVFEGDNYNQRINLRAERSH